MRKVMIFALLLLVGQLASSVCATDDYVPGAQTITSVGDTTTASSWYYLSGSKGELRNVNSGWQKIRAFQFYDKNNYYDIYYTFFGNSPSANSWGVWNATWGPYQNNLELPLGVFVGTTGTTDIIFESK